MANTPPLSLLAPKKGSTVYFAPEGETIETVTVASDDFPAGSVFTDWKEIGCIEDASVNPVEREGGEDHYCFNRTTGEHELVQSADANASTRMSMDIVFKKVTPFVLQMAYAAASVGSSDGAFVPNSQPGGVYRGVLFVQTQRKLELETVLKLWVEISVAEATKIHSRTVGHMPNIKVQILSNALNAGTMGTNS